MPFFRIDGTVGVVGAAPDGDSVRFTPTRPDAWTAAGLRVKANAHATVQLRLDAIDALETHYTPPGGGVGQLHQPPALGDAAARSLLEQLGFTSVTRSGQTVTSATPASVPATVLTSGADKYGRAVAFLFAAGAAPEGADGARVFLHPDAVTASVNAALLGSGLAYPTFYSELYADLRAALTTLAAGARDAGRGVWPVDATTSGVQVRGLETLTESAVVLPKLFRRLVEYLGLGTADLSGFRAFLDSSPDRVLVLDTGQVAALSSVVAVEGQTVRMLAAPDRLVFFET
ncbi:hypothetical protein CLV35_1246 [Motilibacter peucedani]|uniref:Nuclease n=1 Tax=Motilibacter peucedani TaxID=598650 RepID=A0A420XRY1_9ACTN|nr:nuclease [Motilibacter peucedani]RKS77557.1 hypothetical protein CLV35_1246 [Motilibacter peucedani]